jgi:hypothetical protein
MRIAFVDENSVCTHVLICDAGWEELFPGSTGIESETASPGEVWNGAAFERPSPAPTVEQLLAEAAAVRWQKETAGIQVAGATIATDRESQQLIAGALALAQQDPARTLQFKAVSGWVTLSAAEVTAIAIAVGDHVQACFAIEADVAGGVAAGTITTFEQILAADWPETVA